jgi:hypothetical protein
MHEESRKQVFHQIANNMYFRLLFLEDFFLPWKYLSRPLVYMETGEGILQRLKWLRI